MKIRETNQHSHSSANDVMPAKLLNAAMQSACQGGGTTLAPLSRSAAKAVRQLLLAPCLEMYVILTVCLCLGSVIALMSQNGDVCGLKMLSRTCV